MVGGAAILVGIGIVISTFLPKSMQYYLTVDELLSSPSEYSGKELKVAGKVALGSVDKDSKSLEWKFRVENASKAISVTYVGAMPDTFKEGADVVVTGHLDRKGHMLASHVLAKCASRYEEKLKPGLSRKVKVRT